MIRLSKLMCVLEGYSQFPCMEGVGFSHHYCDLVTEVRRWQDRFDALGIQAGCVVGLRADYSFSAVAALLALGCRGSIPALIPRDRPAEEYLTDARACALLEISIAGTHQFEAFGQRSGSHPLLDRLRTSGETGFILFTSGSTGRPKAALHSFERFLYKFDRPGRSLRTLAFLLFDHVAGLDTLFYTFWNGGTLILTYRRDPQAILDVIESQRVEVLPTSPSFLRLLCALNGNGFRDLSSLKVITYGSEPMDSGTLQRVNELFPNARIVQKYGTSELGSPRTVSRGNNSLWLRFKDTGIQTRIVDGVLWLRSEGTMLGYLNTPSPVTGDGWYCTGDLVETDGEWIRFLGRADEIIKVAGEKVVPGEVESVIRELDFVRGAFVKGESHPLMGSVVSARVVVSPMTMAAREAASRIRQHCRERLGGHKVPLKIDVIFEEAPTLLGYRLKAPRKDTVIDEDRTADNPAGSATAPEHAPQTTLLRGPCSR